MNKPDWWEKAICKGMGFDLFFPPPYPLAETNSERTRRESRAKVICRQCPVKQQCLQDSLVWGDDGVRGGTTPSERRRMITRLPERRQVVTDPNWTVVVNKPGIASKGNFRLEQNLSDSLLYRVVKNDETLSTHNDELEAWIALHKAT